MMQYLRRKLKNNFNGILGAVLSALLCTIAFAYQLGSEKTKFENTIENNKKDIEKVYDLISETNKYILSLDKKIIKIQMKLKIED